jgi:tRNA (cmo5U34)-methyltransferase
MPEPTGASSHLGIPLQEYDARIRTFVPWYEAMLDEMQGLVDVVVGATPVVIDLGIGTGALSERCLLARPAAHLIGIDADADMLAQARTRLEGRGEVELRTASFLEAELPPADLIVSSIALHHVAEAKAKQELYARCRQALGGAGALLLADCFLPAHPDLARRGMTAWRAHLERHYPPAEATRYLEAWSGEDTYFRLVDELAWLRRAGFRPDVVWRRDLFAVVLCPTR